MKVFLRKPLHLCFLLVMVLGALNAGSVIPEQRMNANFRLLVSAGALVEQDPYQAFYSSRLFFGDASPPFVISDAKPHAFSTSNGIFYCQEEVTVEEIARAQKGEEAKARAILSHSFRGLQLSSSDNERLTRYLNANSRSVNLEKRSFGQKVIWAFSKDEEKIHWPTSARELERIPAVVVSDDKGGQFLFAARPVADSAQRFALIDQLRKDTSISTGLIELGASHSDSFQIDDDAVKALKRRFPLAVMPGTYEMASLLLNDGRLNDFSLVYPFDDHFSRTITVEDNGRKTVVNLWSITGDEKVWPFYTKLGKTKSLADAIARMIDASADPDQSLNIVRTFSPEVAHEAAKSVYVDVVLLVDPFGQLHSKEILEQRKAGTDMVEPSAPIVRISSSDISEVILSGARIERVLQVVIKRHAIGDHLARAEDVARKDLPMLHHENGLPDLNRLYGGNNRMWKKSELQMVLGGAVLEQTGADLAIVSERKETTSIAGEVPLMLAATLLSPEGYVSTTSVTGKQLKSINTLNKNNEFSKKLFIYGLDAKTMRIGDRVIDDNERFTIACDDQALLEIFGLARMGGLNVLFSVRAPFIEATYGDMKSFYFIGGPKILSLNNAGQDIRETAGASRFGNSFYNIVVGTLRASNNNAMIMDFIDSAAGRPHHVITLDIAYLDIGLSKNVANKDYDLALKEKLLPMGRGKVEPLAHLFLFAKGALTYDAPSLITTLSGEVKYMHTNLDEKPEKDKTKIGLKFRLPWERTFFRDSAVVMSPIMKNIYETKLVPHFWSHPKNMAPRTQRIDSLLGFNFDFTKLGFNVDIGGVMATDFTQRGATNALDFGPGLNFLSRWNLFGPVELSTDISSYYLFPLPQNTAKDKLALGVEGTLWLRLARIYDFSIAGMTDILLATVQNRPNMFAVSSIFGLTISYGRLFRLLG